MGMGQDLISDGIPWEPAKLWRMRKSIWPNLLCQRSKRRWLQDKFDVDEQAFILDGRRKRSTGRLQRRSRERGTKKPSSRNWIELLTPKIVCVRVGWCWLNHWGLKRRAAASGTWIAGTSRIRRTPVESRTSKRTIPSPTEHVVWPDVKPSIDSRCWDEMEV